MRLLSMLAVVGCIEYKPGAIAPISEIPQDSSDDTWALAYGSGEFSMALLTEDQEEDCWVEWTFSGESTDSVDGCENCLTVFDMQKDGYTVVNDHEGCNLPSRLWDFPFYFGVVAVLDSTSGDDNSACSDNYQYSTKEVDSLGDDQLTFAALAVWDDGEDRKSVV